MSGTYVDSVPRVERDTVADSPPFFYHSTQLSCRQNNQCLVDGLRAKGYVCVSGWSLSSSLCAHLPALRPRNGQAGSRSNCLSFMCLWWFRPGRLGLPASDLSSQVVCSFVAVLCFKTDLCSMRAVVLCLQ